MTASHTDSLLKVIVELREHFPDWRLGQLVANLATAAGGEDAGAIWDAEDEELLIAARRLIARNTCRRSVEVRRRIEAVWQQRRNSEVAMVSTIHSCSEGPFVCNSLMMRARQD